MKEQFATIEIDVPPKRLDYGAVPLDPWNAVDPRDRRPYQVASLERIDDKLTSAMADAVNRGWADTPELAARLYQILQQSLHASQTERIDRNATILDGVVDDNDPRVIKAKAGLATPLELLGILIDYPKLGSIELAKLSHPLDGSATIAMDADMHSVMDCQPNGTHLHEPPRHKPLKRVDMSIPAGVVPRKQSLMNITTPAGTIQITQRQGLLVRGDDGVDDNPYIGRKIKNPARYGELTQKIEGYLPYLDQLPDLKWLQPVASSYYAKYLKSPEQESISDR